MSGDNQKPTDGDTQVSKGGRPLKFTEAQVAEAIVKSGGILAAVAVQLDCDRMTVRAYLERFPALQDVLAETKENLLDLAETKLITNIRDGNLTAVLFYLKCQGKSRGYVERLENAGTLVHFDAKSLTGESLKKLTDGQLEDIRNGRPPRAESGG